ncbi:MAG: TonB-dependent receptor [Steroidobacteraceae bacterium]
MKSRVGMAVSGCIFLATVARIAGAAEDQDLLDEVVVSATRSAIGIPRGMLGSSISIVGAADMQSRQVRVVSDVLRDIPGVAVSRAGAVGSPTQVRIRGTEGNQTLVLIDGVEAADPYFGEFEFGTLIADDVARVEVLRGQQSALYGSDAIGGVISYTTLSGREAPGASVRVEYGSLGTVDAAARFGGESGILDYAVSGGVQDTDGYPTARNGDRDVGARNIALNGRFAWTLSDALRLKSVLRLNDTRAEFNDQDFSSPYATGTYGTIIDSDDYYRNRSLLGMLRAEFGAEGDRWQQGLQVQGVDAKRRGFSDGALDSADKGGRFKASYDSTFRFGTDSVRQMLTVGADYEKERFQNTGPYANAEQAEKHSIDNLGLVAQYNLMASERIGFGASIRGDNNKRFDDAVTYRVEGSYRFDGGTRLRAATGSGIKNPTPTEIFGFDPNTFIGNPDLKPEKSEGWEAGVEQSLAGGHVLLGATYFDSKLKNEIYTVFTPPTYVASPDNRTTRSKQKGVELTAEARLAQWRVAAAYTDLNARENLVREVRRPATIASVNVGWRSAPGQLGTNLTVRYNGRMLDSNFTGVGPSPVALSSYTLVNLGVDWKFSDSTQLYGRIENLLDADYEEVYTYATPGRAAYLGVRVKF